MRHAPNTLNLVADIGGTNTRVALASGGALLGDTVTKYKNAQHSSLKSVLERFIEEQGNVDAASACLAIAGPVQDGKAEMTNLDWEIDRQTLINATRAETAFLVNDLQAQGYALGNLPEGSEQLLFSSTQPRASQARMMVGLGTGFNIAPVFETGSGRYVAASESGHISLPISNDLDAELSAFFEQKFGYPTVEHALSGSGLTNLYEFHAQRLGAPATLAASDVMAAFESETDEAAKGTVEHFVRILGTVCGDLALVQLPYAGIYLVGGVSRAITPHLERFNFLEAFRAKGRFSEFMEDFTVLTIKDDFAALTGCAAYLAART